MNIQDISKVLPGFYAAQRTSAGAAGSETGVVPDPGMVDRYEASSRVESELPSPDGPASRATPEALRRYVIDTLVRQYSQGNSYFRLLYDREALPELLGPAAAGGQISADEAKRIEEARRAGPEYEMALRLVGEDGGLGPRAVAEDIGAAAQLMLNLNPQQNSGFRAAINFAFNDFGKMFGGELPPITQQTLMTFTRDYDPFRSGIHVSQADDPVTGTAKSGALEDMGAGNMINKGFITGEE